MDALELAKRFHETYERLAPQFGYETRKETREFNPHTPNGKLMVAVCGELLESMQANGEHEKVRMALRVSADDDLWEAAVKLADENAERGLTLATLCDMVLGENADDRSDGALVRAVGMLLGDRKRDESEKIVSGEITKLD